jgi:hypothetical protein
MNESTDTPPSPLTRSITFTPAYDKRSADPSKNYGVHGCDLRFILGDARGYVQFLLFTGWHLPEVQKEFRDGPRILSAPMPADLGYHSPTPRYDGHEPMETCDLLCGPCYYDGSGLNAERIYEVLLREGSDGVWRELQEYWNELFGQEDPRS